MTLPETSFKQSLWHALRTRCAVCGEGRPFSGLFSMDAKCSACRYHYKREPGYFIGAMYMSYGMGVLLVIPPVLYCMLTGVAMWVACGVAFGLTTLLSPLIFRYSRGVWVAWDLVLSPLEPRDFGIGRRPMS